MLGKPIRLYNAGSAEMFGTIGAEPAHERSVLRPRSPYGIAKATSYWQIAQYRDTYGIRAATGILFNHESPLRPERFVTQKIVAGACRVAAGEQDVLSLGDLSVRRDWGWAPEYVVAMHRMLQLDTLASHDDGRGGPEDDAAWRLPTARAFFDEAYRHLYTSLGPAAVYPLLHRFPTRTAPLREAPSCRLAKRARSC
jgi:hypothetical protein